MQVTVQKMDTVIQVITNVYTMLLLALVYLLSGLCSEIIEIKTSEKCWWGWVPVLNTICTTAIAVGALVLFTIEIIKKRFEQ